LSFAIKRVYAASSETDGQRVLVDRVWPRGVTREAARIDDWAQEIAPSTELRKWFDHDPARWSEFQRRFHTELEAPEAREKLAALKKLAETRRVTLVFAAKDEAHCNASALLALLTK
jgi:uncharacterized protein YeaO (DUF488 family)